MALRTATRQRRPLLVSCASSRPCFGDQLLSAESTPEDPTLARRDAKSHNINPSVLILDSHPYPLDQHNLCLSSDCVAPARALASPQLPPEGSDENPTTFLDALESVCARFGRAGLDGPCCRWT
ncbi:hypothetical protein BDZ90DRAFT_127403 [Jaminaea rosea]|uniref:Uncharacterized protein n=1 Tax=Jaminaea rosea TaxID=1569628 RepID=A0A316UK48_9BASI|nr:hypothetical protein BDZ90DRAFT_127403 [Jaminaea rosea]PWN24343.1 hypothetical protein BDZ90DRAFT_127403 [Jaminaea rosea]